MEKSIILKKVLQNLLSNKTKDYTYLSIFFIVFSIFIFFAIRPSLVTAFSLKKEEKDLKRVNELYDKTIENVVANQALLEEMRDKILLLSQALSDGPNINKVLNDVQKAALDSSVVLSNLSIQEVGLVEPQTKSSRSFVIRLETKTDFEKATDFIKVLKDQRRLKNIKVFSIGVAKDSTSTQSASLEINMEVEGFYL